MLQESTVKIGPHIRVVQVVVPCADLAADLHFFTERLGFKVNLIVPADAPVVAVSTPEAALQRSTTSGR